MGLRHARITEPVFFGGSTKCPLCATACFGALTLRNSLSWVALQGVVGEPPTACHSSESSLTCGPCTVVFSMATGWDTLFWVAG
eukprot:5849325-Amphidinium_carterae.1